MLDDFNRGFKRADSVESFPSETRNFTRVEGRGYGIHATLLTMAREATGLPGQNDVFIRSKKCRVVYSGDSIRKEEIVWKALS